MYIYIYIVIYTHIELHMDSNSGLVFFACLRLVLARAAKPPDFQAASSVSPTLPHAPQDPSKGGAVETGVVVYIIL